MTNGTHMTFGFLAMLIYGNITGDYNLGIPLVALWADIDTKESIVAQSCTPIAAVVHGISTTKFKGRGGIRRFIETFLDHRHITHSLIPLILFYALWYWSREKLFMVLLIGWGSHLASDIITVQGIPIFYPLWAANVSFGGIRTGSRGEEVVNDLVWAGIGLSLVPVEWWIIVYRYLIQLAEHLKGWFA